MKNPRLLVTVFLIVLSISLTFILIALQQKQPIIKSDKFQITASFYPIYFFTSQIGGDKVEVDNLTPAGVEPHDFEPTTQDIARIQTSRMLVLNGGVEAWGDKIRDTLNGSSIKIVVAGDGLLTNQSADINEPGLDPHIWLSPKLAKIEVEKIRDGFIAVDPTDSNYYEINADKLMSQLDQLDQSYKTGLNSCQKKDIITSHAAFGYLAKDYGLTQKAIAGLSPDAEPSLKQLADLVNFARQNNIKYIFFESLVSPKLAQTLADEVGAQTLVLDPIEGVSDKDIAAGKNYLTIMQDNLNNLKVALGCK